MSLLLDALKKAELAKQVAKAESAGQQGSESVQPAHPETPPRTITTREKLPDITQPIEILSDDLPSPSEQRPAEAVGPKHELALEEPEPFESARPAPAPVETASAAGRAQAEQLFQVKEMNYNPRRPFYLTLAALGVVAAGYGGYVWWQLQPHYAFAGGQAASAAPTSQVAAAPAVVPTLPQAPAPAVAVPQAAKAPSAAVAVIPPIQAVRPRARPQAAVAPVKPAPALEQPAAKPIEVNASILAVDPLVQQGYQAFQRNDLAAAGDAYQKALAQDPNNRDALLGLAAIDVRRGQLESAESRYLKLLEANPRDSQATAGLVALRGRLDPAASESRLKILIANQPESAHLQFALGNQYALQSRWNEAQAAYFKAFSIDPENADYAFNLAVSLDQMHQSKSALDYYQRALALAVQRTPTFDPAQLRARVQELSK
ncbi:MAG TPA: tetratricopeptide repeat protein [Burkholderiales bacterium]|nr:tetratricopeptide repeat protein [Burkholderiales bacterium]HYA46278.1 tetratricopeptide repeat protein [Burkholderiales bacterium]